MARTRKQLVGVPTNEMTPAEYRLTDTPGAYEVTTAKGTRIRVEGLHSAEAVAGDGGTIKKL